MNQFPQICTTTKHYAMIANTRDKQIPTLGKGTYELVRGNFSPEEATDVLLELFLKQINFQAIKNFSQQIRFDAEDLQGLQRINELKMAKDLVMALIAEAKESGKSIRVISTVSIELI